MRALYGDIGGMRTSLGRRAMLGSMMPLRAICVAALRAELTRQGVGLS